MSPHKIDTLPSLAALSLYGISENGFLPAEAPLECLPQSYYEPWERIVRHLPTLLAALEVRNWVDELPVLDTTHLSSEREWHRAYSMLAIIAQAYVWQGPEPAQRLPPAISIPFLTVSSRLEVHPIATYAALNLWNYRPTKPGADLSQPDDLAALLTQTGTEDESWFFVVSNAMEARAGPIIAKFLTAMQAVEDGDTATVIDSLKCFQRSIRDIGLLLERMDERCQPQIFYHEIRPFLAGSVNMEASGLSHGVFYDEGNGRGSWRKYRGGSNGQSSLLQFFDAVLGVKHERCNDFHAEMRDYMPGPHKRFLDDIEAIANIRGYVETHQSNSDLVAAFNHAVANLSEFRDKHIALVTRYIIIPSRMAKPASKALERKNLAYATTKLASEKPMTQELIGTGGTKLIPFLRTSKDETSEALVGA